MILLNPITRYSMAFFTEQALPEIYLHKKSSFSSALIPILPVFTSYQMYINSIAQFNLNFHTEYSSSNLFSNPIILCWTHLPFPWLEILPSFHTAFPPETLIVIVASFTYQDHLYHGSQLLRKSYFYILLKNVLWPKTSFDQSPQTIPHLSYTNI